MNRRQLAALPLLLLAPANGARAGAQRVARAEPGAALAIEHVSILPMTGDDVISNATVLIKGDRIVAIGDAESVAAPDGTMRLDGMGKWLMPGLMDMHVHIVTATIPDLPYGPAEVLSPYLANGVLQIVDLASSAELNALRDEIAAGHVRAPRLATARMVDGDPPIWGPETATVARTPDEARQAVTDITAAGYDFIKVYSLLDTQSFRSLLAEAAAQGIRVIGHIPGGRAGDIADALLPGLALVAHAEEYAFHSRDRSEAKLAEYVALARETGSGLISTLFLDEQILAQTRDPGILADVEGLAQVNPVELPNWFEANRYTAETSAERIAELEEVVDFTSRLVKAFVDAGIPVLAGTDTIIPGLAPGYALHEELRSLARAGLSNTQILQAATSGPAHWLGVADDRGRVAVGQRANLMLLDADPRDDIRHTRAIAAIVLDGQLIVRADLDAMMSELDTLYTPLREVFSPIASEVLQTR